MKYTLLFSFAISTLLYSCKKDDAAKGPTDEDIQQKKIEDVIPQKYLDTLKVLGFNINAGVTPPNIEGSYDIKPYILDTSNISNDYPRNHRFADGILHLSAQSTKDFSIQLVGENFITIADTSVVTAISGSGNNFTVYGKVKSVNGSRSAIIAMIMTGTKDGNNIRNFRIGIINIDNSNGAGVFIPEGKGRIGHDADFISERRAEKVAPADHNRAAYSGGIGMQ
jgi:hypothetical protein